ncbi:MAG: SPOR domain-containing protein [Balneolales bacterium]
MKVFAFKSLLFLTLLVSIQSCGPSAEEVREQERKKLKVTERKAQEKIKVYEALELINSQSLAIARGERITPPDENEADKSTPENAERSRRTTTTSAGTYTIQVASFDTRDKAERKLSQWKGRGFSDAFVTEHSNGFRVRLGRYNTNRDAQNQRQRVNENY